MPRARDVVSSFAFDKSALADSQVRNGGTTFAERLREAASTKGLNQADLSVLSGVPKARVNDYWKGPKEPTANYLFALARVLGVSAEWLATGAGPRRGSPLVSDASDTEWVMVPVLDLLAFTPEGKPQPHEVIPVRRPWLATLDAPLTSLWMTALPMSVADLVRAGETILCRDAEPDLVDGRLYIFMREGNPLVRRIAVDRGGYTLISADPMVPPLQLERRNPPHPDEQLVPVARILGRFGLQPV